MASAQNPLTFSSIKALNTPVTDKDSWSFKGTVVGVPPGAGYLADILEYGIDLELNSPGDTLLDIAAFDPEECKRIRKETGISCRTDGARFTVTKVRT